MFDASCSARDKAKCKDEWRIYPARIREIEEDASQGTAGSQPRDRRGDQHPRQDDR